MEFYAFEFDKRSFFEHSCFLVYVIGSFLVYNFLSMEIFKAHMDLELMTSAAIF